MDWAEALAALNASHVVTRDAWADGDLVLVAGGKVHAYRGGQGAFLQWDDVSAEDWKTIGRVN